MLHDDHPLNRLIEELRKIPSIGAKTAQRIAFYLIGLPQKEVDRLADSIREAKRSIFTCSVCNSLTHVDPCEYCSDPRRDQDVLCVVEEPFNIPSIEKSGVFRGVYYVLHGALSPLKGVGPEELKTDKLVERVKKGSFREIILATNPNAEGEATALYLAKLLKPFSVKLTRLAMGLPVGSDIDFADQVTIRKSLEGRTEIKE
ncbi:MAG: recombination mediator RecR [Candidatus Aminicenantales bacterium]